MKAAVILFVTGLVLAGCGPSGRTTKSCVVESQNADGSMSKTIAHMDVSDPASAGFCDPGYASAADMTSAMFGKPAGAAAKAAPPPRTAARVPSPAVAAPRPAAQVSPDPLTTDLIPQCRKTMTGGTGYVCVSG